MNRHPTKKRNSFLVCICYYIISKISGLILSHARRTRSLSIESLDSLSSAREISAMSCCRLAASSTSDSPPSPLPNKGYGWMEWMPWGKTTQFKSLLSWPRRSVADLPRARSCYRIRKKHINRVVVTAVATTEQNYSSVGVFLPDTPMMPSGS